MIYEKNVSYVGRRYGTANVIIVIDIDKSSEHATYKTNIGSKTKAQLDAMGLIVYTPNHFQESVDYDD
jgi:hypothetical protein